MYLPIFSPVVVYAGISCIKNSGIPNTRINANATAGEKVNRNTIAVATYSAIVPGRVINGFCVVIIPPYPNFRLSTPTSLL